MPAAPKPIARVALPTLLLTLAPPGAAPAAADTLELRGGQSVTGEILKETDAALFVDLGGEVVKIEKDRVLNRSQSGATETRDVEDRGIYKTADLPGGTVKQLSDKFGEGVVLVQTPAGLGSGFVISEDGLAVTNYHVVERETRLAATLYLKGDDGSLRHRRVRDVELVALNPFMDLALIRIPETPGVTFKPVFLSDEADYREGDTVFAIGNPLGLERSVSQGIVSNRHRNFEGLTYIQTTTQINPGNSGGPLFNDRGEVIGVTNMGIPAGEGLNFAIPVRFVKAFLDEWEAFAYDKNSPNSGFRYLEAPRRKDPAPPADGDDGGGDDEAGGEE